LVDLTRPVPLGVGPVRQAAGPDPTEDLVELGLGDQERVVLRVDRPMVVSEIEGDVVVDLHDQERAVGCRPVEAQDLGEERRGRMLVTHRHDGVVEVDGHRNSSRR